MSAAYGSYMASSSNLRYQVSRSTLHPGAQCSSSGVVGARMHWRAAPARRPCCTSGVVVPMPSHDDSNREATLCHPSLRQLLAGLIEERGIEVMFKSNPAVCHALSFIVRTGNTFLG